MDPLLIPMGRLIANRRLFFLARCPPPVLLSLLKHDSILHGVYICSVNFVHKEDEKFCNLID